MQPYAIVFKHEDRVRRQPVGPVFKRMDPQPMIGLEPLEVDEDGSPVWQTLRDAAAIARRLGLPFEEI